MDTASVSSPSVEVSLRSAGQHGLTVQELMAATNKAETSVRRSVATLEDSGQAHRVPTMDGAKVVWGPKPPKRSERPINPRRKASADRDAQVQECLRVNGEISLNELARILDMPDIDQDGWSQLAYLSLRRLRKQGLVERSITWKFKGPLTPPEEP